METYILGLGLLGVASAVLIAAFALIQISLTTGEIRKTTEASVQGIQQLIRMSEDSRRQGEHILRTSEATLKSSETTLKMAEATLLEVMEIRRQREPQLH
jgi:hypothetical protein